MPAAAVVTIIGVVVAVAVTGAALLGIAMTLRDISAGLDKVISVVAQIPERTEALAPVLGGVNADLGGARAFLEESRLAGTPRPARRSDPYFQEEPTEAPYFRPEQVSVPEQARWPRPVSTEPDGSGESAMALRSRPVIRWPRRDGPPTTRR